MPVQDNTKVIKGHSKLFLQGEPFCIPMGEDILNVELTLPGNESGVIVFNEATLEGRDPSRETIAGMLNKHNLATVVPDAPAFGEIHMNLTKAADRLERITLWSRQQPETAALTVGYFAVGSNAAAALIAAAKQSDLIKAIVLRGGQPDQVTEHLPLVTAPVLLIAAGRDPVGLRSCRRALEKLNGQSTLNVISRATSSFQEPGVLEESAQLAALWFLQHLG
jgi:putative phosphoribosyl transferase